jgi:hypothetical protein
LAKDRRLGAGKINECSIGLEVGDALQERREVRIGERQADRFNDLAADLVKRVLKATSASAPRRPVVDQCDDLLAAVLDRPLAMIQDCGGRMNPARTK